MLAMILAAGRGERMRPLSDHRPKPLLQAGGKALLVWHLENLARAGFSEVLINTAWLGEQIPAYLGSGSTWGLGLHYSHETTALETAGGIATALKRCRPASMGRWLLVLSGDVWTTWPAENAAQMARALDQDPARPTMHWVMVPNPAFHPGGDFPTARLGLGHQTLAASLTYGNIGVFDQGLFASIPEGVHARLGPLMHQQLDLAKVHSSLWTGQWHNVGSPAQLDDLNRLLANPC